MSNTSRPRTFSSEPFDQQVNDDIFDIVQTANCVNCEEMSRWNYHSDQ